MQKIKSDIKDTNLLNERRAHLARVATNSFIHSGYANASVNDIARIAGISIGSLYKYVRRKEDVLWLVLDEVYNQLETRLQSPESEAGDPVVRLTQAVDRFLRAIYEVRDGIGLMYQECRHLTPAARKEIMKREASIMQAFSDLIEEGNSARLLRCPAPDYAALNILMAGHALALKSWMLKGVPINDYIAAETDLILTMVNGVAVTPSNGKQRRLLRKSEQINAAKP
jgi:AcrR family transcriptional regulator